MQLGYARISTDEQTLHLQEDALRRAGCERLFSDTASGAKADRPGLADALEQLRPADTLVVWRLDRLGRSLGHLIETLTELDKRGIGFKSLTESIDTTTPGGKLIFHIFGALAEFERELIRERTNAGLAAARARGRTGGHPTAKAFRDPAKLAMAKSLYSNPKTPIDDICQQFGVSRSTLYRYMRGKRTAANGVTAPTEFR
jgi:DNA invertase Pin-like site-specific DNA recombinase